MTSTDREAEAARWLLSAEAVRTQASLILAAAERRQLDHFAFHADRLDDAAQVVIDTIRCNYPTLDIPYHARWRHFVVEGTDRWATHPLAATPDLLERARIRLDLVVTSVLLDAGAGADWTYRDGTGRKLARSEGLAIASLDGFLAGRFSADPSIPARADAERLQQLDETDLADMFQVTSSNPLDGLAGRTALVNRLGRVVASHPRYFGNRSPRIGRLVDYIYSTAKDGTILAADLLKIVLDALGDIWPGRLALAGRNLGDTWQHPAAVTDGPANGLVPFHKLSQWLTYSLVEPLTEVGLKVTRPDDLTGLAEYRNGGLFIDTGVLRPHDATVLSGRHQPHSEIIVEWRALTLALLDRIAERVRNQLGKTQSELPLAAILEGGTWAAGRRIAAEKRPGGEPPLNIVSDGSVF